MENKPVEILANALVEKIKENESLRQRIRELEGQNGDTVSQYFVASARSSRNKFHLVSCIYAPSFMSTGNFLEFYSHEEAAEAGYKPCGTCRA